MQNIIKELFWGNVNPLDRSFDKESEYGICSNKIYMLSNELTEQLSDENKDKLNNILSCEMELETLASSESFADGFRLGAKFMLATFTNVGNNDVYKKLTDTNNE